MPWLFEPKKKQMEIMKQYLLWNILLFEKYGYDVGGGDQYNVGPPT